MVLVDKIEHVTDYTLKKTIFTEKEPCDMCLVAGQTLEQNPCFSKTPLKKLEKKYCNRYFSEIGKGKKYNCTLSIRKKNLKKIAVHEGLSTAQNSKKFLVTKQDMMRIKNYMNLSINHTKVLAYDLRRCNDSYNRFVVESNIVTQLEEESHSMDEFFDKKVVENHDIKVKYPTLIHIPDYIPDLLFKRDWFY